ncbi:MAG: hypothetical protein ACXVJ7_04735 [Acidimicrobiia bacterium]
MAGTDDDESEGAPSTGPAAALGTDVAEALQPDPILRVLVSVCNRGTLSFDVTVAQGGLLIGGTAIGVGRFMHDTAADIEARGGTDAEILSEPLRYLAAIANEPTSAADPVDDLPLYLHLEHARIHSAGTIVADDVRWRGRLADVDGWTLGRLV